MTRSMLEYRLVGTAVAVVLSTLVIPTSRPQGPVLPPPGQVTNGIVILGWAGHPQSGAVFTSVGDATDPQAFALNQKDLWQVEFRDPTTGSVTVLGPTDLSSFSIVAQQSSPRRVILTWSQCTAVSLPAGVTFDVTVDVRAPAGKKDVTMELSVAATTASLVSLWAVDFPRVEFQQRGTDPTTGILTYPHSGGWLLPNPTNNTAIPGPLSPEQVLVHPGDLSMQWLSYYDASESDPANLGFGTRDPCGWRKEYSLRRVPGSGSPDAVGFSCRVYPENNAVATAAASFSTFPSVLGVIRGTWYDAARHYRQWAVQQIWCAKGPIRANPDFSDLVIDAEMIASVASSPCDTTPPGAQCGPSGNPATFNLWAADLAEKKTYFDVDSILTHIYFWDHNGFDAYFGDWLPPKPDFLNNIPSYLALGDPFAPYFLNTWFSLQAPGFPNSMGLPCCSANPMSAYAVFDVSGTPVSVLNQHCIHGKDCNTASQLVPVTSFQVDLSTQFAREYTGSIAQTLAAAGAQGIYLDTYTNTATPLNYNPASGNPVGGGCSYTEAKVALVQELRRTMREDHGVPDFFTISEVQQEMFVGVFELVYGNYVGHGYESGAASVRVAPLFDAVYRDHQLTSTVGPMDWPGIIGLPGIDPISLAGRQNYAAFLWAGRIPHAGTVLADPTMVQLGQVVPSYGTYIEMIRNYMALLGKDEVRTFQQTGERLRDPATTSLGAVLPASGGATWHLPLSSRQPLVYAAAWIRPDVDSFGVLLLNWTETGDAIPGLESGAVPGPQTIQYVIDPADYGLPTGTYLRTEIVASGINVGSQVTLNGPTSFSLAVPARSARFFKFKKL